MSEQQIVDPMEDPMAKVTEVQARYTEMLMQMPNVVGVAVGLRKKDGVYTSEFSLVVMVSQKLPPEQLPPEARIPSEIESIPVDVQEVGTFMAF